MRYMMKQRLFSWADGFYIQDESEQNRFYVDGKVFSLGHQFSFQDLAGQELCSIKQVILSWGPSYQIYKAGQLWATVRKELFTFFSARFEVDGGEAHLEATRLSRPSLHIRASRTADRRGLHAMVYLGRHIRRGRW